MASLPAHRNLVRYYGSWVEDRSVGKLKLELEAARRGGVLSAGRPSLYLSPLAAEAAAAAAADDGLDESSSCEPSAEPSAEISAENSAEISGGGWSRGSAGRLGSRATGSVPLPSRTLCMQLELCAAPTLQAILQREMMQASPSAASPSAVSSSSGSGVSSSLVLPSPVPSAGQPSPRLTSGEDCASPPGSRRPTPGQDSTQAHRHQAQLNMAAGATASCEGRVPAHVRWLWVAGVASGLQAMHSAGWLHNDVKPANIFCGPGGAVKLGDFGLATPDLGDHLGRHLGGSLGDFARAAPPARANGADSGMTPLPSSPPQGGQGTLTYMAPERQQARPPPHAPPASGSSDVYSLGICLAELHGGFATAMERAAVLSNLKRAAADNGRVGALTGGQATEPMLTDADAEQLVLQMLSTHPMARPTADQVEAACMAMATKPAATSAANMPAG